MAKRKKIIGKKVVGFRFEDPYFSYLPKMDSHIGEIGTVIFQTEWYAEVQFESRSFIYPIEELKKHIIKKRL